MRTTYNKHNIGHYNLIVARDKNNVIGINNKIPWRLKTDLAMFKELTENSVVVMGHNTWLSLPVQPLPNRLNIVLSTTMKEHSEVIVCRDVKSLKANLQEIKRTVNLPVFFIGGQSVYKLAMREFEPDRLFMTCVDTEVGESGLVARCDLNLAGYTERYRTRVIKDEHNEHSFDIVTYMK